MQHRPLHPVIRGASSSVVLPRRRLSLLAALLAAVSCTPSGPGTTPDACVHVDGRGAGTPDGSAAHPLASIDAAIALLGPAGGAICLSAGEHAPPTAAITAPLVLRGAGPADSVVSGSAGACLAATGLSLTGNRVGSGTVVLESNADLTLDHVGLHGCHVGLFVTGGAAMLADVAIDGVQTGVDVEMPGTLATTRTTIALHMAGAGVETVPGGLVSHGARTVTLGEGTEVSGVGISAGIFVSDTDVTVTGAHFHDLSFGLVAQTTDAARSVAVATSTFENLTQQTLPGMPPLGGANFVAGGRLALDHVVVSGAAAFALAVNGATSTIDTCSFGGADQLVRVQGGTATFTGPTTLTGGTLGLVAVSDAIDLAAPPATVTVMGPLSSTGATLAHAMADRGATLVLMGTGHVLTGGDGLGVAAWGGAHLAVMEGVSIDGVQHAIGSFEDGTRVEVTGATVSATISGVFQSDASTVAIASTTITDATHPVLIREGTLSVTGGALMNAGSSGVRMFGGDVTFTDLMIGSSGGPGISLEGGTLGVTGGMIANSGDAGVAAHGSGTITIDGTGFDANLGAAIELYGGSITVTHASFMPSRPAAGGRIDEIRVTTEGGLPGSLDVGSSNFHLDTLSCPPMTCSIVAITGAGAQGIVRPNCIVATDADVDPGVEQAGGMIMDLSGGTLGPITTSATVFLDPGVFPPLPAASTPPGVGGTPISAPGI